jgi:hypothetical protein
MTVGCHRGCVCAGWQTRAEECRKSFAGRIFLNDDQYANLGRLGIAVRGETGVIPHRARCSHDVLDRQVTPTDARGGMTTRTYDADERDDLGVKTRPVTERAEAGLPPSIATSFPGFARAPRCLAGCGRPDGKENTARGKK